MKYLYTIARNLCIDEYRRVKPDSLPEVVKNSLAVMGIMVCIFILLYL